MNTSQELKSLLERIDRRSYPAYKDTRGAYSFPGYVLSIDHVQGDPFASPSRISIHISGQTAAFPVRLYDRPWKKTALCDTLLRLFAAQADTFSFKAKGSGKSGLIQVSRCGQEVLERSACTINASTGDLTLRLEVGFPASGRTINARELIRIFYEFLPACVSKTLFYKALDARKLNAVAELAENQQAIRSQLNALGLCAFIANGSVLPRASGISQKPMKNAVPFTSPKSMAVTISVPFGKPVTGMGIPKGVTLIAGGGYHGKSTLLEALERGVYNHIAGDGREYVITDNTAMKIRAEDGRSIRHVDISMFINDLPNHKDTRHFDTEDASGSTSQAAGVAEAIEAGTTLMLIDEDTSASNFMVRDALMESVVARSSEPITPLIHRIRQLYEAWGISTILVAGSSGAFFEKSDCIIQMDNYQPREITAFAKEKARQYMKYTSTAEPAAFSGAPAASRPDFSRVILPSGGSDDRRRFERTKIKVNGRDSISINRETIDLRYVEQLVDSEQLAALGYLLSYAGKHLTDGRRTLTQVIDALEDILSRRGLAAICESNVPPAGLALPRRQEIFACFNRCRGLKIV